MPASKAQQKAVTKYVKAKYDRFGLTMPKGQLDTIKVHAAAQGESVNGFINRAIDHEMERDGLGSIPYTLTRTNPPRGAPEGHRAGAEEKE